MVAMIIILYYIKNQNVCFNLIGTIVCGGSSYNGGVIYLFDGLIVGINAEYAI